MTPIKFPEANATFGPPPTMTGQCETITAFLGHVLEGSNKGEKIVVTAWRPNNVELAALKNGQPIFVSFIGGLPPHFVTINFEQAINPA